MKKNLNNHSNGCNCGKCGGSLTEEEFSISSDFPDHYFYLKENNLLDKAIFDEDLFEVTDDGKTNYYIRSIIEIPILGNNKTFMLGVWVSQSKENFDFYLENFNKDLSGRKTFGYIVNNLPYYNNTFGIKCNLYFGNSSSRPKVISLEKNNTEFYKDFTEGITLDKARKIYSKIVGC